MRRSLTLVYGCLAALLALAVIVQVFLAGLGLFVLTTIEISLAGDRVREDAPGVAALHPVLALFVLGPAGLIAQRVFSKGVAGSPATAGP